MSVSSVLLVLALGCDGEPPAPPAASPELSAPEAPGPVPNGFDPRATYLQALLATTGSDADVLFGDGRLAFEEDSRGEGILFRFEASVSTPQVTLMSCAPATWTAYVDGALAGTHEISSEHTLELVGGSLRSLFLKLESRSGCLSTVRFDGLDVRPPRRVEARVRASSVLPPDDAYHPGYLFDGRIDFGWVEGVDGPGEGSSLVLSLNEPVDVAAVEVWNGYQRSDDHFAKNARARDVTLSETRFTLEDRQGPQLLRFPRPESLRELKLTIDSVYPGTRYEDLVLSELRLHDAHGPLSLTTPDRRLQRAGLEREIAGTPLSGFVDRFLRPVCDLEGPDDSLSVHGRFRGDHSFVWYEENSHWDAGASSESQVVLDGSWVVNKAAKPWSELQLYARRQRIAAEGSNYADRKERVDTTRIAGGKLSAARVGDLSAEQFQAEVTRLRKTHALWTECPLEQQALADAWILKGKALSGLVR